MRYPAWLVQRGVLVLVSAVVVLGLAAYFLWPARDA